LNVGANITGSNSSSNNNYNSMVNAFKEALTKVKVVMDDREMGTFITDTMERVVYS
jgi:AAA15 family ATPase/GTPase